MARADETTWLQEVKHKEEEIKEEVEDWLGEFICCRKLAPVTIPVLEKNRHKVLYTTHILCIFCVLLSAVAFVGAFSYGDTLSRLSWVSLHTPEADGHAGVVYKCWDEPAVVDKIPSKGVRGKVTVDPRHSWQQTSFLQGDMPHHECAYWHQTDCSAEKIDRGSCIGCKHYVFHSIISVFVSVFSAMGFAYHTDRRMNGHDGNWDKFVACASALVGGTNFLFIVLGYWYTCVVLISSEGVHASPGVGLVAAIVATVLKIFMGVLHLGLPVKKSLKVGA